MQNGDGDTKVYGINILYDVLQDGDNVTIEKYAELSSDMLELDGSGDNTILHYIVEEGYVELLEHFSDKVTELEGQEWAQKYGISQRTLLSSTCEREQPSLHILQLFVERFGVDVNVKLRGETALHILAGDAHCWQVEALEYLISKGVTIEARNHRTNANAIVEQTLATRTKNMGRPTAKMSDKTGTIKLLLKHGASVENCRKEHDESNSADRTRGADAPGFGLHVGHLISGNYIETGAYIETRWRSFVTADVMVILLNAGADPFAVDDEGRTPLHWLGMLPEDFDEASRDVFVALTRHCPAGKYYGPEYSPAHDVTHGAVLESVFADPALDVDLPGVT
ncbi:hypothetical protein P885DRAFT_60426 [Corynascus similis CBS 632.67]